ncbi:hypothetical protein C5167_025130 [Papaver somniferum]|uniref:Uncharacterized protein n=1 Tax=Papaver somniferum TaxID=3469 RepID=A0A4Y7JRM9_PAPSO|nr:hypothetical protein C5167_025130 [Papaver somniferum]
MDPDPEGEIEVNTLKKIIDFNGSLCVVRSSSSMPRIACRQVKSSIIDFLCSLESDGASDFGCWRTYETSMLDMMNSILVFQIGKLSPELLSFRVVVNSL